MTLTVVVTLAGGLIGGGVWLLVRGAIGPGPSLASFVDELHRPRSAHATRRSRLEAWITATAGRSAPRRAQDLAVCERSVTRYALDRLAWSALLAAPAVLVFAVSYAGVWTAIPPVIAAIAVPVAAIGGWFYALVDLRSDASKQRAEFRHALTTYLELVAILISGGAGVQSALHDAAAVGRGTSFRHLQAALRSSSARREPPWDTLGELGRRIGVRELVELRGTMHLAGDGAHVKDTLRAKAEAMQVRARAEQESSAESRSEAMVLPVALMFAGFLLLIGYPALAGLST